MQPAVELRPVTGSAPAGGLPVSSLRLRRSVDWPVGQAEAELAGHVDLPAPGEAVTLAAAAGRGEQAAAIFTGRVLQVSRAMAGSRLLLEEATGPLTRLRVDATFTSATAGLVIADLAGRANVAARVEGSGAQLPFFAVLASRSAMDWIVHLAFLSGFRLTTTVQGALKAASAAAPAAAGALAGALSGGQAFGPDAGPVIGQVVAALDGDPPSPRLFGDGAFTRQGAGAESWVLSDLSAMETGDGPGVIGAPAIKTPADLKAAQTAWASRLAESSRVRTLTLMAPPPADLGDVITLKGFPSGDGQARIAGITLLWHIETGLQTRLTLHGVTG
jgi:hypothetical protein